MAPSLLLAGRIAGFGATAVVLLEALARTGAGVLPFWGPRRLIALERFGLGAMLGLLGFGFACLGLALTGLFFPAAIAGAGLAMLAGSRAWWSRRSLVAAAAGHAGVMGAGGIAAVAAGGLLLVPSLLVPEFEVDCELYHLALPWQWLQAHRCLPDHVAYAFHLPLPVDLGFTIALLLGDDRIAKWLVAGTFVAASAVWAGRCLTAGTPRAAWTGILLALSAAPMVWLAGTCKNDVPAAALIVCGALCQLGGAWGLGAALFGLGAAAKYSAVPLIVLWCVVHRPPRAVWVRCAVAMSLPLAVWLGKAWLLTGNPFYPLAWTVFPAFDWNAPNQEAFLDYAATLYDQRAGRLATFPGAWLDAMRRDHLLLLLLLPGVLLFGRRRRTAWVCVAGAMAALAAGRFPRYMLPGLWLLALLAAEALESTGNVVRRRALAWVLAAAAMVRIVPAARAAIADWRDLAGPLSDIRARHLTTRGTALGQLAAIRPPGGVPFKVLNVGEFRSYRFPARVVAGGALGETPLVWDLVRASRSQRDLRARFRQLGVRVVVFNCVSVDWLATRYRGFAWDRRMATLYAGFCRPYLELAATPPSVDYENGGFYLYRLRDRPGAVPAATVFFAPGTESLLGDNIRFTDVAPDAPRALSEAQAAAALLPGVGWPANRVGHAYLMLGNLAEAARQLRPFVEAGMLDELNLVDYASAITVPGGRLDEADRVLEEAFRRCPSHRTFLSIIRANWCALKARTFLPRKDWAAASRFLEQGLAFLGGIPPGSGPQYAMMRRDVQVDLTGMLGELRIALGRPAEGARLLREAIGLDPAGPWVSRWRKLADASSGALL
ncbi:MAG: hypothetical protein AAB152_14480 [Candidatus Coatesbacteria bacterium]